MTDEPDIPGIPNQYEYTYSCYTQEMVDKVDEIVAKYNLKLLDVPIVFQRYQSDIFLEETGIQSLLLPDSNAQMLELVGEHSICPTTSIWSSRSLRKMPIHHGGTIAIPGRIISRRESLNAWI